MIKYSKNKKRNNVSQPLSEPKIEKLTYYRKDRWYINRVVEYLPDGDGVYEYMWKDKSWNTTCGSSNMWDSREECERFLYGVSSESYHLRGEDFEI